MGATVRKAVQTAWVDFNRDLEGVVFHMYQDARGLVTTGMGNLIDPLGEYVHLPWQMPDGSLASGDEVRAQWRKVKTAKDIAPLGGNHPKQRSLTTIRLGQSAVDVLVRRKLYQDREQLTKRVPGYVDWPASAQLALHSMAWALGSAFLDKGWPKFKRAALAGDFVAMAADCEMGPKEGTIIERNRRNRLLFEHAATATGLDEIPDWMQSGDAA